MKSPIFSAAFATVFLCLLASPAGSSPAPKPRLQTPSLSLVSREAERDAVQTPPMIFTERSQTGADLLANGRHIPVSIAGRHVEIGFKAPADPARNMPAPFAIERPVAVQYQVVRFRF